MNGNVELLNYIYQNSGMGVTTIEHLLKIVKNERFVKLLKIQYKEYEIMNDDAIKLLHEYGKEGKDISKLQEMMATMSIDVKTFVDKSNEKIVEMMLQGSMMGIIDAIKNIKKYKDVDEKVLDLMKDLLETEERNLKDLKKFLYEVVD